MRQIFIALAGAAVLSSCAGQSSSASRTSVDGAAGSLDAAPDAMDIAGAVYEPRDGARLKFTWTKSSDGVRAPVDFVDGKLGFHCYPVVWPDGTYRCAPYPSGTPYYADPECREAIVSRSPTACADPYITRREYQACKVARVTVWKIGALHAAVAKTYQRDDFSGVCRERSTVQGTDQVFALEPISESELVAGHAVALNSGRVVREAVAFDDGAQSAPIDWRDTASGFVCSIEVAADGKMRCLPSNPATASVHATAIPVAGPFADTACTERLDTGGGGCSDAEWQPYVFKVDRTACPMRKAVYNRGPQVQEAYWLDAKKVCSRGPAAPYVVYAEDPETPPGTYAPIDPTWTASPGTGRLRAMSYGTDEMRELGGSFFDVQLAVRCLASTAGDGKLRCLPSEAANLNSGYFTDPGCTDPIAPVADKCRPPRFWLKARQNTCPAGRDVFSAGELYEGSVYTRSSAGDCATFTRRDDGSGYARVGALIAPSELAEVTQ